MVVLQEANLLKVDICRGRGVQVTVLGKENINPRPEEYWYTLQSMWQTEDSRFIH